MLVIFDYSDFRKFVLDRFHMLPKRGYGQSNKLAQHLQVHTTLVSQVLKGGRSFSLEQAQGVCEFLNLTALETDFFLLLIQKEKAGTRELQKYFQDKLDEIKAKAKKLSHRLQSEMTLDETTTATFYSHWKYSAVRQMLALPHFSQVDRIAECLDIPVKEVKNTIEFLLEHRLLILKDGQLEIGPSQTHLDSSSPWCFVNHLNWRTKAMNEFPRVSPSQLHYTCPMTLSRKDALRIREMIIKFLESVDDVLEPSPSEELHCLNVDWFSMTKTK